MASRRRSRAPTSSVLDLFHPAVREWFRSSFEEPTAPQRLGWPAIAAGESTLMLAPTGSGKTLAAFLACIDRVMFSPVPEKKQRCRVLYVSPLKALAVDVERNLRAPLVGIGLAAQARGDDFHEPEIAIRTGDTPASERARFARRPADILISTPESLYLLLTSQAREVLRSIETVIVDEIHALVPTKRGAHLALSLERLEHLTGRRLQRIGLSATQRPLEEVARFLGGTEPKRSKPRRKKASGDGADLPLEMQLHDEFADAADRPEYRPVTIVDAGSKRALELRVEVPVEDMASIGSPVAPDEIPSGAASQGPVRSSIWSAIHPALLEHIKAHRTTLLFVNSRRIAERLSAALNELAGEQLVYAHHGSLARPQRTAIEDKLKRGEIRGLVATSSLELGIDMGAVDLVIQIEAPPSIASGMQRIGRAGHRFDVPSHGIIFPKYRADLVACAAFTRAMKEGEVEATRYPRNPLDVLAQQLVAMASMERWDVDALYEAIRGAAPYAELSRPIFDGLLDMLAGRYPSDEFTELRPRLTWDRIKNTVVGREGSRSLAVINGGTIPDRGLYGVFLAGAEKGGRVGELDEEMVFESRVGETFVLGASTWRIEEITHDRVLVSPAPGEPGKMPFWHGDAATRPLELGRNIGRLIRELRGMAEPAAIETLIREHDLDEQAARNLVQYLREQKEAVGAVPDDRTLVVERTRDELGEWRVCLLSPLGGRVLAPWAMAAVARAREELGVDVEPLWTNDGFVLRFPDSEAPPDPSVLLPPAEEVERLVLEQLGSTALFAARFREAASRALLLPRRRPGKRSPLWQMRKRSADLLAVSSRYPSFPILLEAYREILRDVFDMPALQELLRDAGSRSLRVVTVDSDVPSPFASAILFGFVANFIYEGDVPLAERRAQALTIDQAQLRELLGEAELRELLDADAMAEVEARLQHLEEGMQARSVDGVHDLLLRLGDLSADEIRARARPEIADAALERLVQERRAIELTIGGERRLVPVEQANRYRDALGTPLPPGLPEAFLGPSKDPHGELALKYARTHAPFPAREFAERYGLTVQTATTLLRRLASEGRLFEGAFRPRGLEREWSDPEVLRLIRRRSLAKLRKEVEPVEPEVLGRLFVTWQGVARRRPGINALLDAIERLQGAPLPASLLDTAIFPARVEGYRADMLDTLAAAGEVVWVGLEPLGERDGRLAIYLTDHLPRLWSPPTSGELTIKEERIVEHLRASGASFFPSIVAAVGGFPAELVDALWSLVWKGRVTNDTFRALRAYSQPAPARDRRAIAAGLPFRSRRSSPPEAEGRWSLLESRVAAGISPTERSTAIAQQLLARYGVVTRELASAEGLPGGFSAVYDVFKAMEESGRIRRGYFVGGVAAMQFAEPGAVELLRTLRNRPETPEVVELAAADPANPWGAALTWPAVPETGARAPTRVVGARVLLIDGALGAFVGKGARQVTVWLPEEEPDRSRYARAMAARLADLSLAGRAGLLIEEINGGRAKQHPFAEYLLEAGYAPAAGGLQIRKRWVAGSLELEDGSEPEGANA